MADITMCSGLGCPLKEKCYRYTAEASPYRQSMFISPPVTKKENEKPSCEYFWENK